MAQRIAFPEWRQSLHPLLQERLNTLEALGFSFSWFLDDDSHSEEGEAAFVIFQGAQPVSAWHAATHENSVHHATRFIEEQLGLTAAIPA